MSKIYLVGYTIGQWEDTVTGIIKAFSSKETAESFKTEFQNKIYMYNKEMREFYEKHMIFAKANGFDVPFKSQTHPHKPWKDPEIKKLEEAKNEAYDIFDKEHDPQNKEKTAISNKCVTINLIYKKLTLKIN